jgi:hypothetical protein
MAQPSQNPKLTFFEVVFQGKPKVVRAFLSGLLMGSGREATVFYHFDEGVRHDGKADKLAALVGVRATNCHVIVDADTSAFLKKLARRIADETGLQVESHRSVRSASLEFSYRAFACQYDDEVLALLKGLPAGLALKGFKHDVRTDPKAKGVEAYSPAHDFEACGEGTVTGGIGQLIHFRRQMAGFPLVKMEEIILKLA